MIKREQENTWCFACGKANPIGLKLHFATTADGCSTEFVPGQEHQSYDGRMHGGLICTLLDETMGNYPYLVEGRVAYTAKMEVRFRQPVLIGEKIKVVSKLLRKKGPLLEIEGKVFKEDGSVAAEALSKMMYEA